jgi:transposase InsO family protein
MTTRTEAVERMLSVVGEYASGRAALPRPRSKKTKPEDPEPATTRAKVVTTMRELGAPTKLCAAALAVSPSTIRRSRAPSNPPRRKPGRVGDPAACNRVRELVRRTHGLVGAATLGRMTGVSRRICAAIKRRELTELERERRMRCRSVSVAAPGIIRGFDAMHVESTAGRAYWLVAADAAVPYRTSVVTALSYDADHVVATLAADFETHGPPLVLRLDRIACQRTADVEALLARYQVLALHGPPRHPYYYGQLERQNREHRAWYALLGSVDPDQLARAGEDMRTALNTTWPRPTLDGWTAEQAWQARTTPYVDRHDLITGVERRTSGLVRSGVEPLHARRIAIESALTERGLLTVNQGGWC